MSRDKKAYLRDYKNGVLRIDLMSGFESVRDSEVESQIEPAKPEDPPDSVPAASVKIVDPIPHRGRTVSFDFQKRFGFVCANDDLGYQRFFFHETDIARDVLGHQCAVMKSVGVEVEFLLAERADGRRFAVHVQLVKRPLVDLTKHREFSRITFWDGGHGFLERTCGDSACNVRMFAKDITTTGIEEIRVGDYVEHGLKNGRGNFSSRATNIVLYEPGFVPEPQYEAGSIEAQFLAEPELPIEPEPTPASVAPAEERAYTDQERHMSLKDIIAARRNAA